MARNIPLNKNSGWVEVTERLVSNATSERAMFIPSDEKPADDFLGHPLNAFKGINRDNFAGQRMWYRTLTAVTLAASE